MAIKSDIAFISLAALAFFGLMSQHMTKAQAQGTPANNQPATVSGGWNATLLDRNSALLKGADLGRPEQIYAGLHNVWATDPVTQAAQRLTWNNGRSSVSPTDDRRGLLDSRSQSDAAVVQEQSNLTNGQDGKPDLSTPLGRFEYYRPIFERRAQQLNEEQSRQQLQFPVYNQR